MIFEETKKKKICGVKNKSAYLLFIDWNAYDVPGSEKMPVGDDRPPIRNASWTSVFRRRRNNGKAESIAPPSRMKDMCNVRRCPHAIQISSGHHYNIVGAHPALNRK